MEFQIRAVVLSEQVMNVQEKLVTDQSTCQKSITAQNNFCINVVTVDAMTSYSDNRRNNIKKKTMSGTSPHSELSD